MSELYDLAKLVGFMAEVLQLWHEDHRHDFGFIMREASAIAERAAQSNPRIIPDGSHEEWMRAGKHIFEAMTSGRLAAHKRDVVDQWFGWPRYRRLTAAQELELAQLVAKSKAKASWDALSVMMSRP